MSIFIVYTIIIVFFIIMFIFTRNYKDEAILKIDKNKNPLKRIYGLSAFIIDKTGKKIKRNYDNEIAVRLDKINMGTSKKDDVYVYKLYRLSLALMVFLLFVSIGYIKCIQQTFIKEKDIHKIERSDVGEGSREYILDAELEDGKKEKVYINLEERKLSDEEMEGIIENSYIEIEKELLGKNTSADNVIYDLNMISNYGDMIDIVWNVKDEDYIDYSGRILWDNIEDIQEVDIEGIFTINDYSKSYVINLKINKGKRDYEDVVNDEVNKYILEYSPHEKSVELPEYINNQKIVFKEDNKENTVIYLILAILLGVIFFMAKNKDLQDKIKKRNMQLEVDYVTLVSKMAILHNSGMTIIAAWNKIIDDYDKHTNTKRYVYEEMKIAKKKMLNGLSETEAIIEFGKRCGLHQYIKFSNMLEQNIKKGTKGLKEIMKQEVNESYELRRALAMKKGDEAGTKLLLPMGIMLIISIVIIIIPAFLSLNI